MGLPTASVSQCRRLDVWTWDNDIERPHYSYIDVGEIESGGLRAVPQPESRQIPRRWMDAVSPDTVNSEHGTLVVWSDVDRIVAQSKTIFKQVETEIGRIYRRYIYRDELTIRMASFRPTESRPRIDTYVRPNDPSYLMTGSSTPEPWDSTPMFKRHATREFTLNVDGREESVEVVYSIAKKEVLGERMGDKPGLRDYGRHARNNLGISVVREGREILLQHYFDVGGGGGSKPENRWWGCEVRFGSGCDDLFGVDHNKQMASYFSRAMRDIESEGQGGRQEALDDLGVGKNDIYEIAAHIRGTVKSMMGEIHRMFSARPGRHVRLGPATEGRSVKEVATRLAKDVTRSSIESHRLKQTQTDRDRTELDTDEKNNTTSEPSGTPRTQRI